MAGRHLDRGPSSHADAALHGCPLETLRGHDNPAGVGLVRIVPIPTAVEGAGNLLRSPPKVGLLVVVSLVSSGVSPLVALHCQIQGDLAAAVVRNGIALGVVPDRIYGRLWVGHTRILD